MPDPSQPNGLLAPRQAPQAPPGYTYTPTAGGYEIQQDRPGMDRGLINWAEDQPLDAAALASTPLPIVGDVAGLANDVRHFYNEPETRTPLNFGLSALGMIPFMPPAFPITRAVGHISNAKQAAEHLRDGSTYESSTSERDALAQLLRGNS